MKIKVLVNGEVCQADVSDGDNSCCKFYPRSCFHSQLFMYGEACRLFHERLKFYNRTELYKRCQACIDAEVAAKKMEILK
ncbi:MAG TPA: hypothetical protein VMW50_08410 [Dehalococcoidia bacterium]|nr:hypothetical protein [Dehalococcoidia bacterium]